MEGRDGAIVDISDLGIITRILFATDGAITHILEAYAGEAVDLVTLSSTVDVDAADRHEAGIGAGERALRRHSLLKGRSSGRVFVHALSTVLLDRLPEPVADALPHAGVSLLKLLTQHRTGTFRESLGEWEGTDEAIATHFGIGAAEVLVARTYQIVVGGRPVAWVTESFPKNGFSSPPAPPISHVSQGSPTSGRRP